MATWLKLLMRKMVPSFLVLKVRGSCISRSMHAYLMRSRLWSSCPSYIHSNSSVTSGLQHQDSLPFQYAMRGTRQSGSAQRLGVCPAETLRVCSAIPGSRQSGSARRLRVYSARSLRVCSAIPGTRQTGSAGRVRICSARRCRFCPAIPGSQH